VKEIKITVDNAYFPNRIEVKKGEKVRLLFYRKEDSECTNEVVFKSFGIRKKLPAFKTTVVEFTPKKAGSFRFACGMDMVDGTVVVK
jgi:plastocyanin domain-containing protein